MTAVRWPDGFVVEPLAAHHNKKAFQSGVPAVDEWLKKRARQSHTKRLSITRVLTEKPNSVAGFYTLAMAQINFDLLPPEMSRKLPDTLLPVVTLAWLGLATDYQGKGLGKRLLAQALSDCHRTGQAMPFVCVLLDCATTQAKSFYKHYDFQELPGHPMTLALPWRLLDAMMQ